MGFITITPPFGRIGFGTFSKHRRVANPGQLSSESRALLLDCLLGYGDVRIILKEEIFDSSPVGDKLQKGMMSLIPRFLGFPHSDQLDPGCFLSL